MNNFKQEEKWALTVYIWMIDCSPELGIERRTLALYSNAECKRYTFFHNTKKHDRSEFSENLEKMFSRYHVHSNVGGSINYPITL